MNGHQVVVNVESVRYMAIAENRKLRVSRWRWQSRDGWVRAKRFSEMRYSPPAEQAS